ncbi:MAG: hypothetical protein ACTHMI_15290 [Mucilaginibacter sp.]
MLIRKLTVLLAIVLCSTAVWANPVGKNPGRITISNPKLKLVLDLDGRAAIAALIVNGQTVIDNNEGVFTSVTAGGVTYSSLHIKENPSFIKSGNVYRVNGIRYGDTKFVVSEIWTFTVSGRNIKWTIERSTSKPVKLDEANMPVFNFDSINTWEGAYQGYGGLAWFYLFNEKLNTYGVHTRSSSFWNTKTNNGLQVTINAPGKKVAMRYTRTNNNKLAYAVTVSDKEMGFRTDSGTWRRRFIPNNEHVFAPFSVKGGKTTQSLTLAYFNVDEKYGRGKLNGINGEQVSAVLNTIARIGVIDSLHYGGNSWHTPYGPICLHEQYIAQIGLGVDDPAYINGYKSCLDYYRDHAIQPDGRVYPRWAYTDEDMMPGKGNKEGFYEAQWGYLLDSNPDFVANVSDLYNLTGDKAWVKTHQQGCEKALDWILNRDSNHNGLVEMMTDLQSQKRSSDWIDIIWASYENAFVNAKLYHALVEWADIERQLGNTVKSRYYAGFAAKLKASFNKPVGEGGFWDAENNCYIHWVDKDKSIHGRNTVTPVNFMAIAYGICDDKARRKIILDAIEMQMEKEKLFFWPLCMYSYAPGEGKQSQYPFPEYENGDIFLSWGSIAVKAYADYKPELAVKYVKNVLEQYSKDGLAFQRYGRQKQDGRGDDILSGNSLSIVGLYEGIYGINPMYNRLYLEPHMTPELAGTELRYKYQGKNLLIKLDNNHYSIDCDGYKVTSKERFGFNSAPGQLTYFNRHNANAALQVKSAQPVELTIKQWEDGKLEWEQSVSKVTGALLAYTIHQLKPNTDYWLSINQKSPEKLTSNSNGDLVISRGAIAPVETMMLSRK